MTKRVVMYSGGRGSWMVAQRVVEKYGTDDLTLLFTDTLIEDEDLYRFLDDSAAFLGVPVTRIADGRTPWELFRDKKFLGNNRVPLCSRILKRELAQKYVAANFPLGDTVLYLGIDWTEEHRFERVCRNWAPWKVEFPLMWHPMLDSTDAEDTFERAGLTAPRLYALGAPHNNCGGACVRAGQGHFSWLLQTLPEVYAEWEREEGALREQLGDVAILRDRRGGVTKPFPLDAFRWHLIDGGEVDIEDIGGCGCFTDLD